MGRGVGLVEQADVRGGAFPREFSVVATMTYADRVVRFWDLATGKLKKSIAAGDNALLAIALSPEGRCWPPRLRNRRPRS